VPRGGPGAATRQGKKFFFFYLSKIWSAYDCFFFFGKLWLSAQGEAKGEAFNKPGVGLLARWAKRIFEDGRGRKPFFLPKNLGNQNSAGDLGKGKRKKKKTPHEATHTLFTTTNRSLHVGRDDRGTGGGPGFGEAATPFQQGWVGEAIFYWRLDNDYEKRPSEYLNTGQSFCGRFSTGGLTGPQAQVFLCGEDSSIILGFRFLQLLGGDNPGKGPL